MNKVSQYAVVDVETTGLFPEKHDRIIEIAIITLDSDGKVQNEYETLINPNRDLGPTNIHKISSKMVQNAPEFKDIAGDIARCLAGRHVVGHNIHFDYKFIKYEFTRLGIEIPESPLICTMKLSKILEPDLPGRSLAGVCSYFDIPIRNSHSAMSDCFATAKLFQLFLSEYGKQWSSEKLCQSKLPWPDLAESRTQHKRTDYQRQEEGYIAGLVQRLPNQGHCEEITSYLGLLDKILADRRITQEEAEDLFKLANEHNIGREKAIEIHKDYLKNLARIALRDGTISKLEMEDIGQCASLLNISSQELEIIILAQHDQLNQIEVDLSNPKSFFGKTVCFTGTLNTVIDGRPMTREEAHIIALEYGLIVRNGVTKDLDYLVTADPYTMSGKAKKARQYDIDILAEQSFWNMLSVSFG